MKAVVLTKPCSPEELEIVEIPVPAVKPGWVLVKIKAFGLNRSELYTRQGHSPGVKFPRVIGIECTGEIEDPSDSQFTKGEKVVSIMGGLGRDYDGSYAEYALIPAEQVYAVQSKLDWPTLAAIPESWHTAYESLFTALQIKKGESLFIRGGTSSVGLAAIKIAKAAGATVIVSTRNRDKTRFLFQLGADRVLLDDGTLKNQLLFNEINGVHKVLELVGAATIRESLQLIKPGGILCMTGILSGWILDEFEPLEDIPSGVYLTAFHSGNVNKERIHKLFRFIDEQDIQIPPPKVFSLEDIQKAHRMMEDNTADGKMVVVL